MKKINKLYMQVKSAFTLADRTKSCFLDRKLKNAFTLAELLIVLGIIGIVAALTMPTLISNYKNQVLVTSMQKSFSVLSQAMKMATIDEDDYQHWLVEDSANGTKKLFEIYLKPYMQTIKECSDSESGCWTQTKSLSGASNVNLFTYSIGGGTYQFITADGMNVNIDGWGKADCTTTWGTTQDLAACMSVVVDVNGNKKPNQLGKDVFGFILTSRGLVPAGVDNDSSDCHKNGLGFTCAAKVLREGKISY